MNITQRHTVTPRRFVGRIKSCVLLTTVLSGDVECVPAKKRTKFEKDRARFDPRRDLSFPTFIPKPLRSWVERSEKMKPTLKKENKLVKKCAGCFVGLALFSC